MALGRTAAFLWPPKSRLSFYGRGGRLVKATTERDYDLADGLMLWWPHASRTLRLGITSDSPRWPAWTEAALGRIEELVRYDLNFDGYRVAIERLSAAGIPAAQEFLWGLRIREV